MAWENLFSFSEEDYNTARNSMSQQYPFVDLSDIPNAEYLRYDYEIPSQSYNPSFESPPSRAPAAPEGDGEDYKGYFVTSEKFETHESCFDFVKSVANRLMFEVVIASSKTYSTEKYVKCSRGIPYRGKSAEQQDGQMRQTSTKACMCPFQLKMKQQKDGYWEVVTEGKGARFVHNHPLMVYHEGNPQLSKLSTEAVQHIKEMTEAQVKPHQIQASLKMKFPKLHPTLKQIYNQRSKLRTNSFDGRSVVGQFYHLATDKKYFVESRADPATNVITHLFVARPSSMRLFSTYHYYVGMDSTYKTNKYKFPLVEFVGVTPTNMNFLIAYAIIADETADTYEWVLRAFKKMMGTDVAPTVIVTDKEGGLLHTVNQVFPNTAHLLCRWHIGRDVEAYALKLYKGRRAYCQNVVYAWSTIFNAQTEDEYNSAIYTFNESYGEQVTFIRYIQSTWLQHREKFIPAWTNGYLHLGNVTNCRVESAHSKLKSWLYTSTGSLDSLWKKIDKELEGEEAEIKKSLEQSRNRRQIFTTLTPFQNLSWHVSHYCLQLLCAELERVKDVRKKGCYCAFQTTHGIPCACELKETCARGESVPVERIHPFWRTLEISPEIKEQESWTDYPSNDHRTFQSLADEVKESNPATIRSVNIAIQSVIHPESANYGEPEPKDKTKGRPKRSSSTARLPSAWELLKKTLSRQSKSKPSSSKPNIEPSRKSCSVNNGPYAVSLQLYRYKDYIPEIFRKYVEGVVDVRGDGNCGFRAVSSFVFGSEDNWQFVRKAAVSEFKAARELYGKYFIDVDDAIDRIEWFEEGCPQRHWMTAPRDLYPIATYFNVIIISIGFGTNEKSTSNCCTIFPSYVSDRGTYARPQVICIALIPPITHFIRLNVSETCPMPPIPWMWYKYRRDSVKNLEGPYRDRLRHWQSIAN